MEEEEDMVEDMDTSSRTEEDMGEDTNRVTRIAGPAVARRGMAATTGEETIMAVVEDATVIAIMKGAENTEEIAAARETGRRRNGRRNPSRNRRSLLRYQSRSPRLLLIQRRTWSRSLRPSLKKWPLRNRSQ